jgi:hypothetical protein
MDPEALVRQEGPFEVDPEDAGAAGLGGHVAERGQEVLLGG